MSIPIKPIAPEIDSDEPFKNCKLNRKQYADALTPLLNVNNDGFVLAIDNPWGAGKTTFIKMWQQDLLKNMGHKCIYFNAWENDFEQDPLLAILGELKNHVGNQDEFKNLLKKGGILVNNILPTVLGAIATKYIDTKGIQELIQKVSEAGVEILEDEINSFAKRKAGIEEFREALKKYITKNCEKPLVFFIDELDRCNPNYAVKVLEKVKHFFTVEGIVFVLSIDKGQLCNSIKGYFGSDKMDASEYLRRFIDIEFSLPKPKTKEYCSFLYEYYKFDDFIKNPIRKSDDSNEKNELIVFSTYLFENNSVTLRQQEKIFSHARLSLRLFNANGYLIPGYFILLIFIKLFKKDLFDKLTNKGADTQQLIFDLESLIDKPKVDYDINLYSYFTYNIALILFTYNKFDSPSTNRNLIDIQADNTIKTQYKSSIKIKIHKDIFDNLRDISYNGRLNFSIDQFIHKINLIPTKEE